MEVKKQSWLTWVDQMYTYLSNEPVATYLPSGLKESE